MSEATTVHRMEVSFTDEFLSEKNDGRAKSLKDKLKSLGFSNIDNINIVDIYTLESYLDDDTVLKQIASRLSNSVTQQEKINEPEAPEKFDWAVEVGFLPAVTDNVAKTAKEGIENQIGKELIENEEDVYTSEVIYFSGNLVKEDVKRISKFLANLLIERIDIKSYDEFIRDGGMDVKVPKVSLKETPKIDEVNLDIGDEALKILGKQGILNDDGETRRGPLALSLEYLKTISDYFENVEKRTPTDLELETLAQTWSEHCKHTIFADPMDDIKEGLFKTYIKGATDKIRKQKGNKDFCVSIFLDNSGAINFDENYLLTDKAETHNSPSALDPFGGAITGIVGVNRDTIGFGKGARPIINSYGYCFADPRVDIPLFKGKRNEGELTDRMPSSRNIMDGVIGGVEKGGNQSGIPTNLGFLQYDERYRGKPLVFVRTTGIIPKKIGEKESHKKEVNPGDSIIMVGGRVGKDGVHGATFSSEAMDSGSPATAVQIGDPITQKKMSDALMEARDLELYNGITDNGAGGLSSSVGEMATLSGGFHVDLEKVPLKYSNIQPWEIWISESQERMTLSVSPDKEDEFIALIKKRGVEATVIGTFNDSKRGTVTYNDEMAMDMDMDFLHNGLPRIDIRTAYVPKVHEEPTFEEPEDFTKSLLSMLGRLNIASYEFISEQYDHEVQGGSVLKPLQGKGRVNGDAAITRPVLNSGKGVVTSQGINPAYSDIDTYNMAACAIDTAIRNTIAVGGNLDHLALMDNFCWCSSDEPEMLGMLKRAVEACHDYSIAYGTPFISGKDSMFNDFKGFDEKGNPVKISVPPTLLVSSISVMDDVKKTVSLDAKVAGDLVYVLGDTYEELGGSEYFAMAGEQAGDKKFIGNSVPKVDAEKNKKLYYSLSDTIQDGLVASAQSVHKGGLAVALAKTAMGGLLGMDVSLENLSGKFERDDSALYSESQGRLIVTINPECKDAFESKMKGNSYSHIGTVREDREFNLKGSKGDDIINTTVDDILESYRATFRGY